MFDNRSNLQSRCFFFGPNVSRLDALQTIFETFEPVIECLAASNLSATYSAMISSFKSDNKYCFYAKDCCPMRTLSRFKYMQERRKTGGTEGAIIEELVRVCFRVQSPAPSLTSKAQIASAFTQRKVYILAFSVVR